MPEIRQGNRAEGPQDRQKAIVGSAPRVCRCSVCSRIFFRFVCAYCETPRCHNTIETGAGSRPAVTATPTARGSHYACDVPWSRVSLRPCGGEASRRVSMSVSRERLRLGSPAHPAELGYAKKCADIIII